MEKLGYSNYVQLLNAKDYGIPQSRNRCFMVSLLGEYHYEFPHKIPLKRKLKDMLEDKVDEKYYLSKKTIDSFTRWSNRNKAAGNGFSFDPIERERERVVRQFSQDRENEETTTTSSRERERERVEPVWLNHQGEIHPTEVGVTLLARDYKGVGVNPFNGVLESSPSLNEAGVIQIQLPRGWMDLEVKEVTEIASITTSVGRWNPLISEPTPNEDTRQPTSEIPSISPIPTARPGEEESEEEWHRPSSQSRNKE